MTGRETEEAEVVSAEDKYVMILEWSNYILDGLEPSGEHLQQVRRTTGTDGRWAAGSKREANCIWGSMYGASIPLAERIN